MKIKKKEKKTKKHIFNLREALCHLLDRSIPLVPELPAVVARDDAVEWLLG